MTIPSGSAPCQCRSEGAYGAQADSTDPLHKAGRQRFNDFKALRAAIKSGDIAAAQKAFEAVKKDLETSPNDPKAKQLLDPSTTAGKDFAALAEALKGGKTDSVQQAFAKFQQDLRADRGGRAHGHGHAHPGNDGDGDDGGANANPSNARLPQTAPGLDAVA